MPKSKIDTEINYSNVGIGLILCPVNHFCVDLNVCFGPLSCWKIQRRPSFLTGPARFRCKISWYFILMMPCTLYHVGSSGLGQEKQPHYITEPPPPPYLHTGYFWCRHSSFYAGHTLSAGCRKAPFSFHLTIEHGSSSDLRTPGTYVCGEMTGKAFFLACLPNHLLAWR